MDPLDFLAADILGDGTAGSVDLEAEYVPPARALRAMARRRYERIGQPQALTLLAAICFRPIGNRLWIAPDECSEGVLRNLDSYDGLGSRRERTSTPLFEEFFQLSLTPD